MPGWLGSRAWALTLWLSTYWAHPRQLGALGTTQIGWMILSPLLIALMVWSWRAAVGPVRCWRPKRRVVLGAVLIAGDDPMRMVTDELIPRLRAQGLGVGANRVGIIGISMGGYGALLLTEKRRDLFSATAAISPAIWTTYEQARSANPAAFASAADFAEDDVISHAHQLDGVPVRIASGASDPFHPGVMALAARLPRTASLHISPGCHDTAFFHEQQLPALRFLGDHLSV